jgi:hypothetical protein
MKLIILLRNAGQACILLADWVTAVRLKIMSISHSKLGDL